MNRRTGLWCAVFVWSVAVAAICSVSSNRCECGSLPEEDPGAAQLAPTATPKPTPDPRAAAVRTALEQGMEVDQADEFGRTALMMAAFEGYTEVVSVLLEYGAEIDRLDASGRTALMYASSGPFPATVDLLLEKGSNPDLADTVEGWTALMFAAGEGNTSVVETLLRHGADATIVDEDGDAAFDHAWTNQHQEVVTLLQSP